MIRYYIILLIKGTLVYRVADNVVTLSERILSDADLPDVTPLGYCSSEDWLMEWQVSDALRDLYSVKGLELINQIRQFTHE